MVLLALVALAMPAGAQLVRTDAVWARQAPAGSITLDGNLNEPVWAQAEKMQVTYLTSSGIPGSGYKVEGASFEQWQYPTNDSTNAYLRFLVIGNKLYLGATVPDLSIGGGGVFNAFDGFLMGLKNHSSPNFPKPVDEYLYSWWYPRSPGIVTQQCNPDSAVGAPPTFKGLWAPDSVCDPVTGLVKTRNATQIAAWDARTIVNGTTNSDLTTDVGYTVEMVFDLGVMGYDATKAAGDTVEWNISIYDTDNNWKPIAADLTDNRTWLTSPWGRDMWYDELRIYTRPSVTTSSGALPTIDPDFRMPITGLPAPTIDGNLNEGVWAVAPSFRIHYDDDALRGTYPSIGKYRSGQYQPRLSVNDPDPAALPNVVDPGDATVKYFWKGDNLYLGFDVNDVRVQSNSLEDEWDGFNVTLTSRTEQVTEDHGVLKGKALAFHWGFTPPPGPVPTVIPADDLPALISAGQAEVAMQLKPGSTLDSLGNTANDVGYTAEMRVDLKGIGYPPGLGDHTIFFGCTLYDQDRFASQLKSSYGTRAWFFREREQLCCPAWTLLDGTYIIGPATGVDDGAPVAGFAALGNSPNPFKLATTLEFILGKASNVGIEVFDLSGRLVHKQDLGRFTAGHQTAPVELPSVKAGVYLYRLTAQDPATGAKLASFSGKMMHLQ